jgi:hypothetical protein
MDMLEDKYLTTLGRNILMQLELNKELDIKITELDLGKYAWIVANFVEGESIRDARERANKAQWDEKRMDVIGQNGNVGYD